MSEKFWQEKITLGKLSFPRVMSAPVDGITDSPMRQMIRQFSNDELLFTEMFHISCVANEKTERCLKVEPHEHPIGFQVSGSSPQFLEKAIQKIISYKFDMLNLNAGCPAKNVIKSGSGSALMAEPKKLETLLRAAHKELAGAMPLTLKMRAGFKEVNALDIALLAQDCGVEMLIIHPRTQIQGFTGDLNFDLVKKIKQTVSIPVIFSGNIIDFETAEQTYEKTGVDGFMIGRALWGAPWKLREIREASEGKTLAISTKEILACAIKHLDLNIKFYGDHGVDAFKKHLAQYVRGVPGAASLRHELLRLKSHEEMRDRLLELAKES
ncbi:tRNA-dihydrouridine synthase [Candidatus Babeliales bacterium]|nr:tRNA-dihydrouridine synthase [Candidatus Babeliales bacterium]